MKNFCYLLIFCGLSCYGQEFIELKIQDKNQQPLMGAVVHFLGKHYVSDLQGIALIPNFKKGTLPIKVTYLGFEDFQEKITFPLPQPSWVIQLQESVNQLSEVVLVGEAPLRRELIIDDVITKEVLTRIGTHENLAKIVTTIPGVAMIQTGATIAKPVIHGLHSNRVLILNNEVRQEGQQWGADHAPEIDPSIARTISVVKGASAVRYGSDALGGVIVISPSKLPYGDALHGEFSAAFDSNGRKNATTMQVESSSERFPQWAWRVQGSLKRAGDMQTADYLLNNTAFSEQNFSLTTGIEQEKWGIEAFYSRFANELGVFYGSHIGNLEDLQLRFRIGRPLTIFPFSYQINAPKQEVVHHLAKIKTFVWLPFGGKLSAQYAFQGNIRKEFNIRRGDRTQIPSLHLNLTTHSLDISWENSYQKWKSEIGVSTLQQVNYSQPGTGVVPVIPNFATQSIGAFGVQKYAHDALSLEAGIRYDYKTLNADGYDMFSLQYGGDHHFHNVTYLAGGSWVSPANWKMASTLGWSWRSPQVNELYSNGLHHGAGTYDLGDTSLEPERGIKWLISVGKRQGKFTLEADLYAQLIKNYIYDAPTGETQTLFSGVYPIFKYQQADAFFRGADLNFSYHFLPKWTYTLKGSVVYANELRTGRYFPFIPSERVSNELSFEIPKWKNWKSLYALVGHRFVNKQYRYDPAQELVSETPDAYHLFHLGVGGKFPFKNQNLEVHLSVENVLNKAYKEYTNRFRYYAHDMGRNIQLRVVYSF